jgi:MinD superfamily P-loop ATPase
VKIAINKEPFKIGVVSGKGGVGKTSIAASLGYLAKIDPEIDTVILLDCDVDAPNLALLFAPEGEILEKELFTTLKAQFIEEKCVHCKKCIDENYCEFHALKWDDENQIPIIDNLSCEGCGACAYLCTEDAFLVRAVKSGLIKSYITRSSLPLVYGETILGSTSSGKTVSECKEYASEINKSINAKLMVIDGPPGIGCPVIATISGLNYVLAIVEPTPSGLHDVIRVIEVSKQFNIPFSIIVNKADLESEFQQKFRQYISENGFDVIGRIPFDFSVAEAISNAKPVVLYDPNSKASIVLKEIYEKIKLNILGINKNK